MSQLGVRLTDFSVVTVPIRANMKVNCCPQKRRKMEYEHLLCTELNLAKLTSNQEGITFRKKH